MGSSSTFLSSPTGKIGGEDDVMAVIVVGGEGVVEVDVVSED